MSHFTVLVIGPDHEKQLQPFHEFECTGTVDEFVQDVDETEEKRDEFATDTRTVVALPTGEVVSAYDERFYRDKTAEERGGVMAWPERVRELPPGLVPFEQKFERIEDWAEYNGHALLMHGEQPDFEEKHKFGYIQLDEAGQIVKAVRRTNPNKKWDWWQVGGRWSGFLKLKPGGSGSHGKRSWTNAGEASDDARCDSALKRDVDFDGMRDERGAKAGALWDKAQALTGGQTWEPWDSVRERMKPDYDSARTFYNSQPAVVALREGDRDAFLWDLDDALSGSREAFVAAARNRALATFAVLHRGEWTERGEMGWWACVSNEMDANRWYQLFNDMLDGLPEDTLLTVVDCHT
jgi:hypothetical protein